jgi:O-Antigen ligase
VLFFPPAEGRRQRLFGSVTWVFIATACWVLAGLVVGLYVLHNPDGSLVGLRPYYNTVLAAFVVWRVLRSMPRERAEATVVGASVVVGLILIAIGAVRVFGIAGTAVEIEGVPITFFDAAGPYVLLCCVGVWGAALTERRVTGPLRILLAGLVVSGLIVAITSQRRAILIGYAIAAVVLLLLNMVRRGGGIVRSARILLGVTATLAAVVVLIALAVPGAGDLFEDRAGSAISAAQESTSSDPSLQYRVDESDAVYALAGRNLWTGIGPRSGFVPVNSVSLPTDGSYTHNTYLTLPLRYGLWGILALATLVIGLVITLSRGLLRGPPRQAWIMAAALIALLPAIATAAFLTQTSRWAVIVGAIAGAFDALTDPPGEGREGAADGVP